MSRSFVITNWYYSIDGLDILKTVSQDLSNAFALLVLVSV